MTDRGTGTVHSRVAGTDDHDPLTESEGFRGCEIIDRIGHIAKALALDCQLAGSPES